MGAAAWFYFFIWCVDFFGCALKTPSWCLSPLRHPHLGIVKENHKENHKLRDLIWRLISKRRHTHIAYSIRFPKNMQRTHGWGLINIPGPQITQGHFSHLVVEVSIMFFWFCNQWSTHVSQVLKTRIIGQQRQSQP